MRSDATTVSLKGLPMRHHYATRGTCSKSVEFEIDNGLVRNIAFEAGCPGNLQGLARLAEGRSVEELIKLLSGVKCGEKKTSCPDQFARALKKQMGKEKK